MFIDKVEIRVKAGDGGPGCVSFRREKYVPRGGPDGGNGGRGGDIVIAVEPQMKTLLDLRYRRSYKAPNGISGQGARKTGLSGEPVVIKVPPGTVVEDVDSGRQVADLTSGDAELTIARGGDGGRGNFVFRTATNQAPLKATPGFPGEERNLRLTLKLIADVGLVGLPNAGKSTLLRSVSHAKPLVADYPFSTLAPNLAIVRIDEQASFCMVDIPGLIEGAHEGKGLGLQFLQHVERCRVLLFILDMSGEIPPGEALRKLMRELELYNPALMERRRVIALNKIDLLPDGAATDFTPPEGEKVFHISALTGDGLPALMKALYRIVMEESGGKDGPGGGTGDPPR